MFECVFYLQLSRLKPLEIHYSIFLSIKSTTTYTQRQTIQNKIIHNKFQFFHYLIQQEKLQKLTIGTSFLFYLICNLVFGTIAFLCVYMEPLSAGSGMLWSKRICYVLFNVIINCLFVFGM